jgi:outer membrane protein assembly factor BamB
MRIKRFIFIGTLILGALITINFSPYLSLTASSQCENPQSDVLLTPAVVLSDTTSSVAIVWERLLTKRDTLLTASGQTLAFHRGYDSSGCSLGDQVIGLESKTGQVLWRFPAQLVRTIAPVNDGGYLVAMCCTSLTRIDSTGKIVWESEEFPVKIYEPKVHILENKVYFQLESETHVLSLEDGALIETLKYQEVFAVFDDLIVLNVVGELAAKVDSSGKIDWIATLSHPEAASSHQIYRYQDILLVVLSRYHIDALYAKTGQKLWEIETDFKSAPILFKDTLIAYSEMDELEIYDVQTGNLRQSISLQRNSDQYSTDASAQDSYVQLAVSENNIFILYNDSSELLALDFGEYAS